MSVFDTTDECLVTLFSNADYLFKTSVCHFRKYHPWHYSGEIQEILSLQEAREESNFIPLLEHLEQEVW